MTRADITELFEHLVAHKNNLIEKAELVLKKILLESIKESEQGDWYDVHIPLNLICYEFSRLNIVIEPLVDDNDFEYIPIEIEYRLYNKINDELVGEYDTVYHWHQSKLIFIDDFFIIHKRA